MTDEFHFMTDKFHFMTEPTQVLYSVKQTHHDLMNERSFSMMRGEWRECREEREKKDDAR
jgi:hypothetical protein